MPVLAYIVGGILFTVGQLYNAIGTLQTKYYNINLNLPHCLELI